MDAATHEQTEQQARALPGALPGDLPGGLPGGLPGDLIDEIVGRLEPRNRVLAHATSRYMYARMRRDPYLDEYVMPAMQLLVSFLQANEQLLCRFGSLRQEVFGSSPGARGPVERREGKEEEDRLEDRLEVSDMWGYGTDRESAYGLPVFVMEAEISEVGDEEDEAHWFYMTYYLHAGILRMILFDFDSLESLESESLENRERRKKKHYACEIGLESMSALCAFLTDMDATVAFDTVYDAPKYAGSGRWVSMGTPAPEPRPRFTLGELLCSTAFRGKRSEISSSDTASISLLPSLMREEVPSVAKNAAIVARTERQFVEGIRLRGGRSLAVVGLPVPGSIPHRALLAVVDDTQRKYVAEFARAMADLLRGANSSATDSSAISHPLSRVGFRVFAYRSPLESSTSTSTAVQPADLLPYYNQVMASPSWDAYVGADCTPYMHMAYDTDGMLSMTLRVDGADHVHHRPATGWADLVRMLLEDSTAMGEDTPGLSKGSCTVIDLVYRDRSILMHLSSFVQALVVPMRDLNALNPLEPDSKLGNLHAGCTVWRADGQDARDAVPASLTALLGVEVYAAGRRLRNPCVAAAVRHAYNNASSS